MTSPFRTAHRALTRLLFSATLVVLPGLTHAATFGPQSSGKAAEWGFDFVEEFDGLQDWDQSDCRNGSTDCGNVHSTTRPERMPKLLNGQPSAWGYFSIWNTVAAPAPWIGSETASGRKIWRGNKSLTIDIGETNYGPSRMGVFMGDGYRDFSLFYMVWIPKNMFPTSCEGGRCAGGGPLGTYTEGQPYHYFAAWKFNTFNMECKSSQCPGPYGLHSTIPGIKQYNYTPNGLLITNSNHGSEGTYAKDGGISLNPFMGDWWGVEFRIRNISNSTEYLMDIWVYDKQGKVAYVMKGHRSPISAAAQGGVWDLFFFGGNNSNSWTWGPTMQSHYYVDDLIIDAGSKGAIGPRYFSRIGTQGSRVPPSPPTNPQGLQANAK